VGRTNPHERGGERLTFCFRTKFPHCVAISSKKEIHEKKGMEEKEEWRILLGDGEESRD